MGEIDTKALRQQYVPQKDLANYDLFDQDTKLGPKPWKPSATTAAWEIAHGHDPRLECYVEYRCQLVEDVAARHIRALCDEVDRLRAILADFHQLLEEAKAGHE